MSAESIPGTDQVKCNCGWQGTTEDLEDKTCPKCGEAFKSENAFAGMSGFFTTNHVK